MEDQTNRTEKLNIQPDSQNIIKSDEADVSDQNADHGILSRIPVKKPVKYFLRNSIFLIQS